MFEFVNEYSQYQLIGPFRSAGIYFRQNCFNYEDLKAASNFWDHKNRSTPVSSLYDFRRYTTSQHSNDLETVEFAASINDRVQAFVDLYGTDEDLPLHESKRIYMRINPDNRFGQHSTALYYNQFRIGYLRGSDGPALAQRVPKKRVEAGFGIVAGIGNWGPYIEVMAPTKRVLEKNPNLKAEQPKIIYYEDYTQPDEKMPPPPQHLFN